MRVKSSLLKWLVILLFVSQLAKSDSFYKLESRSSTWNTRNRNGLSVKSPFLEVIRHRTLDIRNSSPETLNDVTDFRNSFVTFRTRVDYRVLRAKDMAVSPTFRLGSQKSDVPKETNYGKETPLFEKKMDTANLKRNGLFRKTKNTAVQINGRRLLIRSKQPKSDGIRNVRTKMIIDNSLQSRSLTSFDNHRKSLVRRQDLRQVQGKQVISDRKFYMISARKMKDTKQMIMKTTPMDIKQSEARLYSFEFFSPSSQRNSIFRIHASGMAKVNLRINNRRNSQISKSSLRSRDGARNSDRRINLSHLIVTPDGKSINRNPVYENKERIPQGKEFEVSTIRKKVVTESIAAIFKKRSINILKRDSRSIFSVRHSATQRFSTTRKSSSEENFSTQHYRRKSLSDELRRNTRRDNNSRISNNNMENNVLQDKHRKETDLGHQTGRRYQRILHSRSNRRQNDQQRWNIKSGDEIRTTRRRQNFGVQKIDLNRNLRIQHFRKTSGLYSRKMENTISFTSQRYLNDKTGKYSGYVKESKSLFTTSQNDETAHVKQMSRGRLHVADKQAQRNFKNFRNEHTRETINDPRPLDDVTFDKTFDHIRKRRDNNVDALHAVRSSKKLRSNILRRNERREYYAGTSRRTVKSSQEEVKIQNGPNERLFINNNIENDNNLKKFRNVYKTILSRQNGKRFREMPLEERYANQERWTSTNDFGIRKFERIRPNNVEIKLFQNLDRVILNCRNGRGFRGKFLESRYAGHDRRTSRNHLETRENKRLGNRIGVLRRKDYPKIQDKNMNKRKIYRNTRKIFISISREFLRKERSLRFGNSMDEVIDAQKTVVMSNEKISRMTVENNKNFPSEQMQLMRISVNGDRKQRQQREISVSKVRIEKYIASPIKQIYQKDKDFTAIRKLLFREQKLDVQTHRTTMIKNKRLLYRQSRNLQISRRENSRSGRSSTIIKRNDMRDVSEAQFTTQRYSRYSDTRLHSEIRSHKRIKNSVRKVSLTNNRFSNQFVSTISLERSRFSSLRTEGYRKVSLIQQATVLMEKDLSISGTIINNYKLQFKSTFSGKFYLSEKDITRCYKVDSFENSSFTETVVSRAFYEQQNYFKPITFADVQNNTHQPDSHNYNIFSILGNSKQKFRILRTSNGASSQIRIVNDVHSHHYARTMFHHFHASPTQTVNIRTRSSYFSFPVSQRRNKVFRMKNKSIRLTKGYTPFESNYFGTSFSKSQKNRNIKLSKAITDSTKTSPLHECFIELPVHNIASCISFKSNFSHNEGKNIFRPHMKSSILSVSRSSTKSSRVRSLPENKSPPVNQFLSVTDNEPQTRWFESIILRKSNIISFFSNIVMGLGILMAVSDDRNKGIQYRFRNRFSNCLDRLLTLV
ncbi:uncharacterized protein LOC118189236 [Stegodyphus dumicola]|uniref:uncharacterized protein LOC118189236 n=1 Tax=Stegodyphus dumicola TaxID=202533 RepID=UPI0015AB4827|nr:uncharacterized protein LOC118189236 [Stegodyphus dumicola]